MASKLLAKNPKPSSGQMRQTVLDARALNKVATRNFRKKRKLARFALRRSAKYALKLDKRVYRVHHYAAREKAIMRRIWAAKKDLKRILGSNEMNILAKLKQNKGP